MTADCAVLIDAGREGHDSGRITERVAVVEYLRAQAAAAHDSWLKGEGSTATGQEFLWRRYTTLQAAAGSIEAGRHLS